MCRKEMTNIHDDIISPLYTFAWQGYGRKRLVNFTSTQFEAVLMQPPAGTSGVAWFTQKMLEIWLKKRVCPCQAKVTWKDGKVQKEKADTGRYPLFLCIEISSSCRQWCRLWLPPLWLPFFCRFLRFCGRRVCPAWDSLRLPSSLRRRSVSRLQIFSWKNLLSSISIGKKRRFILIVRSWKKYGRGVE